MKDIFKGIENLEKEGFDVQQRIMSDGNGRTGRFVEARRNGVLLATAKTVKKLMAEFGIKTQTVAVAPVVEEMTDAEVKAIEFIKTVLRSKKNRAVMAERLDRAASEATNEKVKALLQTAAGEVFVGIKPAVAA